MLLILDFIIVNSKVNKYNINYNLHIQIAYNNEFRVNSNLLISIYLTVDELLEIYFSSQSCYKSAHIIQQSLNVIFMFVSN